MLTKNISVGLFLEALRLFVFLEALRLFTFFALPIKLSAFPQEIPETAAYTAPLLHWLDGAR